MSITPAPAGFKVRYCGRLADGESGVITRTLVGWDADGVPMVMDASGYLMPAEDAAGAGVMFRALDPGVAEEVEWELPLEHHEPVRDRVARLRERLERHRRLPDQSAGVVES